MKESDRPMTFERAIRLTVYASLLATCVIVLYMQFRSCSRDKESDSEMVIDNYIESCREIFGEDFNVSIDYQDGETIYETNTSESHSFYYPIVEKGELLDSMEYEQVIHYYPYVIKPKTRYRLVIYKTLSENEAEGYLSKFDLSPNKFR